MQCDTCFNCKHYLHDLSCMAFERIPAEIMDGRNGHTEVLKGQDNDYTFLDKRISDEELDKYTEQRLLKK